MRKGKSAMNDEYTDEDFDTMVRLQICDLVNNMAERNNCHGNSAFDTPEQFIAAAEMLEHYITQGGTVAFNCSDNARKFVRGE